MILEQIYKYSKESETSNASISKSIIDEITSNKGFNLTVVQLAEKSGCSQSTVSKYIKNALEIETYRELVVCLNKEITRYFEDKYNNNNFEENSIAIISDLQKTLKNLDPQKVKEAATLIFNAEKICIAAIGGNIALKYEIEHKLSQTGKFIMIGTDWHQQSININFMKKNDVVILISYSGDKFETNRIIEKANEKGITVITFTGAFPSKVKSKSNCDFQIESKDAKFRSFSFTSRICAFAIWEMIFKDFLSMDVITSDVIDAWKWQQK
ncbi:RpiR family transcriptional regulator [Spiroplasma sabaudiense Ar-1343]|uniref:RpiR family transcriptional regulator n=1 Tax=Spiroplasma sabaudiense Ar-1343 TaxID=1276257 RepID=W6A8L7_9MOLU|nr:MurR/RpiR family transcriptional regulator [Spiroplasma sabaudiense]AHI53513.1 RpiR family transcriptional regulator [Spiroplasma sabaudiense Ar-1343]